MDYPELVRLAAAETEFHSCIDAFDQRFLNPPDMPQAIQSFCRETKQRAPETEGQLVRCALESLAEAYQKVLCGLEELNGSRIDAVHIVGGGSRNHLLNQLTANRCGRRVFAGPVEA